MSSYGRETCDVVSFHWHAYWLDSGTLVSVSFIQDCVKKSGSAALTYPARSSMSPRNPTYSGLAIKIPSPGSAIQKHSASMTDPVPLMIVTCSPPSCSRGEKFLLMNVASAERSSTVPDGPSP